MDFRKEHRRLLALAIKSEGRRFYKGDVRSQKLPKFVVRAA